MCPSFRATGDEQHLTRGRANTLRLAVSGQLGPEGLAADAVYDAMDLCVGCKGCKRECPTGVDMARMKIEFLHHYHGRHGWRLGDRLVAYLPRYAPLAARLAPLANLRDRVPLVAAVTERLAGFSAKRSLPRWRGRPFLRSAAGRYQVRAPADCDAVLFVDTFGNYFEPENAVAALRVLEAAGLRVHVARPARGGRALCCGRTFLAVGMVNEARDEAHRVVEALAPYVARGVPVVGLEPSCLLTLRDEFRAVVPGDATARLAEHALLLEEFLVREAGAGRLKLRLNALPQAKALLHGHCHQKAFDAMPAVERALRLVPGLEVETIESSCCGMAGAFGYEARHYDVSMRMAEAALLPRVRVADDATLVVADGTSCRHQIADGAGREAIHVVRVLERALARSDAATA
jgi:Fe-S oxidoreductase